MRTALVTGGTGGLGQAVTQRLLADGWRCVVPYAVAEQAEALRKAVGRGEPSERLVLTEADLFDDKAVGEVVALGEEGQAPVAAVVNLVGGFDAPGRVHEVPVERFEQQLRVNLLPTYQVCAGALPGMLARGEGAIVCVSAGAALRPFPGAAGYITAKAAVLALVDVLATEYTADGVRTNAILPSVIDTPGNRASQPDADYSRWVPPQQIAGVIAFLCSAESAPTSGAHVPVFGRS